MALLSGGTESIALVRTTADSWVVWMRDKVTGDFKGFDEPAELVVVAALDDEEHPTNVVVRA